MEPKSKVQTIKYKKMVINVQVNGGKKTTDELVACRTMASAG